MPAAPQLQESREAGTFGLVLEVGSERRLEVGSLGSLRFPQGQYAYAGQAKRGFEDRVARLVDAETRARRHVDRVVGETTRREAVRFPGQVDACDLATHMARFPDSLPVIGFGATGCTCLTHLHGFLDADRATVEDVVSRWDGGA